MVPGNTLGGVFACMGFGAVAGLAVIGPIGGIAYCFGLGASEAICLVVTGGALGGGTIGSAIAAGAVEADIKHNKNH